MGVALIFIVLRLHVKLAITHQWGWDDMSCVIGFVCIVAHNILYFTQLGPGDRHSTHVQLTESYLKRTLAGKDTYAASALFVKLSLFLLYLRLFSPSRTTRWLVYGGIFACGAFYTSSIVMVCALCSPKPGEPNNSSTWLLASQSCGISTIRLAVAQSAFSALSDAYLIVLPVQLVFRLQLPMRRKIGVSIIFMIGLIAIACSVSSLAYRIKLLHTTDSTWFGTRIWVLSTSEVSAGIICSCTPVLAALFRTAEPRKSRLPSFHYFRSSWFTFHGSRSSRLFMADKSALEDNARLDRSPGSRNDYIELQDGACSVDSQNSVKVPRSVENF